MVTNALSTNLVSLQIKPGGLVEIVFNEPSFGERSRKLCPQPTCT